MTSRESDSKERYEFRGIEPKWRDYWRSIDLYRTGDDPSKPNKYILDFFPYPSGDGLSVGHCRNYVPTCVSARFYVTCRGIMSCIRWVGTLLVCRRRIMLSSMAFTAGKQRPILRDYRRQMKLVECSYDWSREIYSTDPDYYHWTQWFFLLSIGSAVGLSRER